ncbi:hypothetical protein [Microtetraspora glauca]|uniref:STAS domain-containing protein n=1 Tax=Microtetraspora glauca TaxID=1996 RepID=A0ABV3GA71_MICGL
MHDPTGAPETFEVTGRLNLKGAAEFLGIRHQMTGKPVATLRVLGVDLDFTDTAEADRFAQAAMVMANQLHIAHDRNEIAREPQAGDPA